MKTTEEKAKAYDEAIIRAEKILNNEKINIPDGTPVPIVIFPELGENKNNKIIDNIIDILENDKKHYLEEIHWLENRKISKDDEIMCKAISKCIEELECSNGWHHVNINGKNIPLCDLRKWFNKFFH